jgi:hypothetical protein
MKKLIYSFIFLQIIFGDSPKFGDEQIAIMMDEYFLTSKLAPVLIGHRFYISRGENVIQIEIEPDIEYVNDALLFSFKAMSQIANISKTKFTQSVLVMHFGDNSLPTVAKADLSCSKEFFIHSIINEDQWRKNCLTISGQ